MTDTEAREYLLKVIEITRIEAGEYFGRIKDAMPHSNKRTAQILYILWSEKPRIMTYGYIAQEVEHINGSYHNQLGTKSAVKRLRRALEKPDIPVEIRNHSGIGYNVHAPVGWRAARDDD